MDFLIPFIGIVYIVSAVVNWRRFRRGNERKYLRLAALFVSCYVAIVYLCGSLGVIPEPEIRFWMRWMIGTIGVYFIAEAING